MSASSHRRHVATALGIAAVLLWSTSNGLTRDMAQKLGPFTLVSVGFGTGGAALAVVEAIRLRSLAAPFVHAPRYLLACGTCLVAYLTGYAWALALAPDNGVTLVLGLVNYLWPTFILAFAPLFVRVVPRWRFALPGIALGPIGVALSLVPPDQGVASLVGSFRRTVSGSPLAFGLMLGAAVSWALYTHLARVLSAGSRASGVPVLALAASAVFFVLRTLTHETSDWGAVSVPILALFGLGVCGTGYVFWDLAARWGDIVLVGAASMTTPLLATCFTAWYLGQPLHAGVAAGALAVVVGAALGRAGMTEIPNETA